MRKLTSGPCAMRASSVEARRPTGAQNIGSARSAGSGHTDVGVVPAEMIRLTLVGNLDETANVIPHRARKKQAGTLRQFKTSILAAGCGTIFSLLVDLN